MKKQGIKLNVSSIIIFLASVFFITKVMRTFSGVVGESGGVWNLIQIAYVFVGILWALKYYPSYRDISPIVIMLLLNTYMTVRALPGMSLTISGIYNYAMVPFAMCVLIIFFVTGMRTEIRDRSLLYYTFYIISIIVIVTMMRFLSRGSRASFIMLIDVADVYYSLGLLPLAFIYVDKKFQFVPIIVAAVALIFSEKRAGLLALIGMVLAFYLVKSSRDSVKELFKKAIIFIVVVISMYFLAQYLDGFFKLKLFYRLSTMSEDGGSGRIERWKTVIDAIGNSNVFNIAVGHGWGDVSNLLGGHAHNDYLELFYEYGLIAVVLYICFYSSLIAKLWEMIKTKYEYANVFAACGICSLVLSVFSYYIIKPTYIACGMLCYGLLLADFKKYRNEIRGV